MIRAMWVMALNLLVILLIGVPCYATEDCGKPFELSTHGQYVIDQCGKKFKLKSVNWYGAQDVHEVVGGLDKQSLNTIIKLIKMRGFNSVRLPFSNRMLHNNNIVDRKSVAANPELFEKTPLEVFDRVVKGLTDAGLVVVLNNHTTLSQWCCNYDVNSLWHHPNVQSTLQWIDDWKMLTVRYQSNPMVAAMDLRNEVRTGPYRGTIFPVYPNWGLKDENDWQLAATVAANEIHKINPHLLIIVEGINWTGTPLIDGYRPLLIPVRSNPIQLDQPNKLVYEVHIYGYTGPKHTGDDATSVGQARYRDMNEAQLRATLDDEFGFVLTPGNTYTAPVWLGEFGVNYKDEKERTWLEFMTRYLLDKDMGWAIWALNSEKSDGGDEDFGLLKNDWSDYRQSWRDKYIDALLHG